MARAGGRCEVVLPDGPRCPERATDVHHVVKRSKFAPRDPRRDDPDQNLVALCRVHHARTDMPYAHGRLVITPTGGGRFAFTIVTAPDKFAVRAAQEKRRTDDGDW